MTNGDKIRNMTDEELAEFVFSGEWLKLAKKDGKCGVSEIDLLQWLQKEVKVE